VDHKNFKTVAVNFFLLVVGALVDNLIVVVNKSGIGTSISYCTLWTISSSYLRQTGMKIEEYCSVLQVCLG